MHTEPTPPPPQAIAEAHTMWRHFTLAIKISIPVAIVLTILGIAFLG